MQAECGIARDKVTPGMKEFFLIGQRLNQRLTERLLIIAGNLPTRTEKGAGLALLVPDEVR